MATKKVQEVLAIEPPKMARIIVHIEGTAPYVQHKFSEKARKQMLEQQTKASGTKGRKRSPREVDEEYLAAMYIGEDGRHGIPAAAFRTAMIDACRTTGYAMTKAKLAVYCVADTVDVDEGKPLVHLEGEPEMNESSVRLESGVASVAIRPMWRKWRAAVTIEWDTDQFRASDVVNLLARAGAQVGIGEGRPYSRKSAGCGWGTFRVVNEEE